MAQPDRKRYLPPVATYHGKVGELTMSQSLLVGSQALRLSAAFASSLGGIVTPGGGEPNPVPTPGERPDPNFGGTDFSGGGGDGGGSDGGVTTVTVVDPTGGTGGTGAAPGGAKSGGGGGGSGGGGSLPFTGLVVIGVAGVGAALASAGGLLRRLAGRDADGGT